MLNFGRVYQNLGAFGQGFYRWSFWTGNLPVQGVEKIPGAQRTEDIHKFSVDTLGGPPSQ